MNALTAPAAITACVSCAVPEATFVRTQAASNCRRGLFSSRRNSARMSRMPRPTTARIGGFRSAGRRARRWRRRRLDLMGRRGMRISCWRYIEAKTSQEWVRRDRIGSDRGCPCPVGFSPTATSFLSRSAPSRFAAGLPRTRTMSAYLCIWLGCVHRD